MNKIPIKIVELSSPSGQTAIDVMIDVYDFDNIENPQQKIKEFKKRYFDLIEKAKKLFYGKSGEEKKYQYLSSSVYWNLGILLEKFNNEIENKFEIKNYTEAISRDFNLSKDYIYDILTIVQVFKKNQIIDSVKFSYYRALKRKRSELNKLNLFQKEIIRLNQMGSKDKLPGREKYKVELIHIIDQSNKIQSTEVK